MKSVVESNTVKRMGIESEGSFRIKATGKAFRILSDGLYSDKITAIIRELSCNAYDAHVAAGTLDKPFTIHLPTQFEPFFSLRDYGVGLSHEDVIQVYTTYFESTKTESNDFIGCLGLGSKSPFSYVDNFSIVSFHDGEKRTYSAFMNEDGIPSIALMATETTVEPNGIQVSFAVDSYDFRSFYSRVPNVFRYFKMKPEITGHDSIEIETVEYGLQGSSWGIRTKRDCNGARAVMGNISYPLSDMDYDKVSNDEYKLLQSNIDIFFDIGELEVAASREKISFNTVTIKNVKNRLAILVKEVSEKVTQDLNACPTLWDARLLAVELSTGIYSNLSSIFKIGDIKYRGIELEDGLGNRYVSIPKSIEDDLHITSFSLQSRSRRRSRYSYSYDNGLVIGTNSDPTAIHIKTADKIKFFIKDIDVGSHVRCKQVLNESMDDPNNPLETVYLISENQGSGAIAELMKYLGYEGKIDNVSIIERKRKPRGSNPNGNPLNAKKVLKFNNDQMGYSLDDNSGYWETDNIDLEDGGIYVNLDRYKINGVHPNEYLKSYYAALLCIGIDDPTIYGVKNSLLPKVVSNPKWVKLRDYVLSTIEKHIADNDLAKELIKVKVYKSYSSYQDNFVSENHHEWECADKSAIVRYLDHVEDIRNANAKYGDLYSHVINLGIDIDGMETESGNIYNSINDSRNEIYKSYPMLKMISDNYRYNSHYDNDVVSAYIKLVDSHNDAAKKDGKK